MPNVFSIAILAAALVGGIARGQSGGDQGDALPDGSVGRLGTTRLRHREIIGDLAFLPDGQTVAAVGAGKHGTVQFWDVASGTARPRSVADERIGLELFPPGQRCDIHSREMEFVSRDGKQRATVASDLRKIVLQDIGSGKELYTFHVAGDDVRLIAFAPDGKSLAIATQTEVRLRHTQTFATVRTIALDGCLIAGMAFSPDGTRLATVTHTRDGPDVLQIWHVQRGAEAWRASVPYWDQPAPCVFSHDSKTIALARHKAVRLWDVVTGKERYAHSGHHGRVVDLAVAADGRRLATIGDDWTIRVWDTKAQREQSEWTSPWGSVQQVAFTTDNEHLILHSKPLSKFVMWDLKAGRLAMDIPGPKNGVSIAEAPDGRIRLSPDGRCLAAAMNFPDGPVLWHWDITLGKELQRPGPVNGRVIALAYAPNNHWLAGLTVRDGETPATEVHLWEAITGLKCQRTECGKAAGICLAIAPDGRRVAVGCRDGDIRMLDLLTGKQLGRCTGHAGSVEAVQFAPDGARLHSASADSTVLIWDASRYPVPLGPFVAVDSCWNDLAIGTSAFRAMVALTSNPKQAVPFLASKLKASAQPDAKEVRRAVDDLDSDDFESREQAMRWLTLHAEDLEPALQAALMGKLTLEARRRIEQVLATLQTTPPERLRLIRAVQVLELIGNADARALLAALAKGAESYQTREARGALTRLKRLEP